MAHHRHAGIDDVPNNIGMPAHTFKFHRMGSGAHQFMHCIHRVFQAGADKLAGVAVADREDRADVA